MNSMSANAADEAAVSALYLRLLNCWNRRDADDFAYLFADDSNLVGFDGSQINGTSHIVSELRRIFTDHQTAAYIGKIKEVRFPTPDVGILRAVVGMIPPGKTRLNPAVNAIQSLVAAKQDGKWRITLFQNTPAQFHGRPELADALTDELRLLL
jgi:uncharacterized protein (TIGR02246 family)